MRSVLTTGAQRGKRYRELLVLFASRTLYLLRISTVKASALSF